MQLAARDLAPFLEHTLLAAGATTAEIDRLCAEALEHGFAGVCVHGCHVRRCAAALAGSPLLVVSVVAFPLGAAATEIKVAEARGALDDGAREVDMVQNVGALRSGDGGLVLREVAAVAEACHRQGARLKVILETCLLSDDEKVAACGLARRGGADFVKTSTGFGGGGATVSDVALLCRAVGPHMGVKAAGGIRDAAAARALLAAGATRLGTSASVAIVRGGC